MPFEDGANKLDGLLNTCGLGQTNSSQSNSINSPPVQNGISDADALITKRLARNFNIEYKKHGVIGLKNSIASCYNQAIKSKKYATFEYCYLLDQIACEIATKWSEANAQNSSDEYWRADNGVARTYRAAAFANLVPELTSATILHWSLLKPEVNRELAAVK